MNEDGSIGSMGVGNTKRPPASIHWCFTYNNYSEEGKEKLLARLAPHKYVFQEEDEGTPHLQGYVAFAKKMRPLEYVGIPEIHWEKCRSPKNAIAYCSDEQKRKGEIWSNLPIQKPLKLITELRQWQQNTLELLEKEPDDRTIYWIWDEHGGTGKSVFAKYLCATKNAIILSGKGSDMKYGIISYIEKHGAAPDIIVIDIPRSNLNFLSYTGIEEIKNGCFFSPKYESGMCLFNCPHVVCFANERPVIEYMSEDRWKIKNIG